MSLLGELCLTFPGLTVPVRVSLQYDASASLGRLPLTGAQTYEVDLALIPAAGLKGLLIYVERVDAAGAEVTTPISMAWTSNGDDKSEELSPGGALLLVSPNPQHGITALSIVTTSNALVHVYALG